MIPELWAHQKEAIIKGKRLKSMALFFDVGTGKTRTILEILRDHYNDNKKILPTLIICPVAVMFNWKNEFKKFTKIPESKIFVLTGSVEERKQVYKVAPKDSIFIINYDSFSHGFVDICLSHPPEVLVLDESHRCKDSTAKRTKNIIKLSDAMSTDSYKYILTGTPVLNSQLDLFTQFRILDGGKLFGKNYFAFRATYFQDKNAFMPKQKHFPNWSPKVGADDKLKNLIAPIVCLAKKDECLDLPPMVRTEIEVEMSKEQARAYESMKKDFIAFLDNGGVSVAQLAITKAIRMQQIVSGFIKTEEGEIHHFKENPRAKALYDLLEDITPKEKVIVWGMFHEDYDTIKGVCNKLSLPYSEVTGLVKDKQIQLDAFEKDPKVRVMISSPAAGGTGVNMIQASCMIYYSRSYSLEHDLQSEARNYRGGSEIHSKITRIDLVAKNSIDSIILKCLRDKKNIADNIMDLKNLL